MGYFSNGTEGMMYYEEYCARCVHDKEESCPIWTGHLAFNYEAANDKAHWLHTFIPRGEKCTNKPCVMFIEREASGDLFGNEG